MAKIKIAQYWGAGCGGCDVAMLDIDEKILGVAEMADIAFWPIAVDDERATWRRCLTVHHRHLLQRRGPTARTSTSPSLQKSPR
jgi:hypothetical protein